jgi:hypothetical protein
MRQSVAVLRSAETVESPPKILSLLPSNKALTLFTSKGSLNENVYYDGKYYVCSDSSPSKEEVHNLNSG